jgi:hypothetical protein
MLKHQIPAPLNAAMRQRLLAAQVEARLHIQLRQLVEGRRGPPRRQTARLSKFVTNN